MGSGPLIPSVIACRICGQPFAAWEGVYFHHLEKHKDVPIASKFSHKSSMTQYREVHKERLRIQRHEYYLAHKKEERDRANAWAKANPERLKESKKRNNERDFFQTFQYSR